MAFNFANISVLVADQEAFIQKLLLNVLKNFKVQTLHGANSSEKAIEIFQKYKHDLIITEYNMSEEDGIALTKKIRTSKDPSIDRTTPVIMMSSYIDEAIFAKARDAGVSEFLLKPFSTDDIAKRIAYTFHNPREFIDIESYVGPDRRRKKHDSFTGPFKRECDKAS